MLVWIARERDSPDVYSNQLGLWKVYELAGRLLFWCGLRK
jgi:hypothetical protein